MSDNQVERLVKSSFERMKSRFDKGGKPYFVNTRPYYSSGGVKFVVSLVETVAGVNRYVCRAAAGQEIVLFSYGDGEDVSGVGLGQRPADNHDTNQVTANRTNAEDVAIEGFSVHSRGTRVNFTQSGVPNTIPPEVLDALGVGPGTPIPCEDPGSRLFMPETHSPITLEDMMWRAIAQKMTLTTQWNKKAVDLIGTMNRLPEGGGNSFLKANGDPNTQNFFRLPEGLYWKQEGSGADTLFSLLCRLQQDVVVIASSNEAPWTGADVRAIEMWAEFTVFAHSRSFFYPSSNN